MSDLRAILDRIPWFAPMRGGWPAVPTTKELPTASEAYAYRLVTRRGPPDATFQCLRGTSAWRWCRLGSPGGTTLTIATGVVSIEAGFHAVATEAAAASDDLDTINGGVIGDVLTIFAASSAETVVAKDGTGNLKLAGDMTLDNREDTLTLRYDGNNWIEMARSNNGA